MNNLLRYSKQILLPEIGEIGQQKLAQAKVLVIGAGGLGCPVLQILASSGVGTIGIVDGDIIEESNLHRQLLYVFEDCGKSKAATAAAAIKKINPSINTIVYNEFVNESNSVAIAKKFNVIVDCTDTIFSRYIINDTSVFLGIPMVYASIHKYEGQLSVFNYKNGPSYRCLFPEKKSKKILSCVDIGVLGVLPNTLGLLQATEVLKIILEIGNIISGKLILYNMLSFQFNEIEFNKNEDQIKLANSNVKEISTENKKTQEINTEEFINTFNNPEYRIIDLREEAELPKLKYKNLIKISFANIEQHLTDFDKNENIILFCQSGQRSQLALEIFNTYRFTNVRHLQNGIRNLKLSKFK